MSPVLKNLIRYKFGFQTQCGLRLRESATPAGMEIPEGMCWGLCPGEPWAESRTVISSTVESFKIFLLSDKQSPEFG